MDLSKASQTLRQLETLQKSHSINIITLSEPVTSALAQDASARTSDVSNSSLDAPTPASLEADLAHYKELFAKLRFSYVEQVTKEKFIRAIVGDPPIIATPENNAALAQANAADKSALKAIKQEVADIVAELEAKGRELAGKYEAVGLETAELRALPEKIRGLEGRIRELREEADGGLAGEGGNPLLRLPLGKTLQLAEEKRVQGDELDRQLEQLRSQVPRKRKEMERLQAELVPLEAKRQNSATAAKEARRRKEAALGGVQDDLEERGRWWRGSETLLKQMLDIQG